ncbi:MAG: hypothetical protein ABIN66_07735 [candidate division WOR-3 bacterium]
MLVGVLLGFVLHPVLAKGVGEAEAREYRLFTMVPGFIEASFSEEGGGARVAILIRSDRTKEGFEERVVRMDAEDIAALNQYIESGNYLNGLADLSDFGAPIWESEVTSSRSCLYTGCSIPLGACLLGTLAGFVSASLTDNSAVATGAWATGTLAGGVAGYMAGREADAGAALDYLRRAKDAPSWPESPRAETTIASGYYKPQVRFVRTRGPMAPRGALSFGWGLPSGEAYSDSGRVRPLISVSGRYTTGYLNGLRLGLGILYLWSEGIRKDRPFDRYTGKWNAHAVYGNLILAHGASSSRTYSEIGLALGLGNQHVSFYDPVASSTTRSSGLGFYGSLFGDITYGRLLAGFEFGHGTGPGGRFFPNMNIHGGIGFAW